MSKNKLSALSENACIHMIGIGGVSMSALAHILKFFKYHVSGSDRNSTEITDKLRKAGIEVSIGHSPENIKEPDLVCYTAAIPQNNPELVKARSLGIPTMERAELLGELIKKYQFPIAVAGTHGKTTTTSMLSLILLSAELDPTILVGGELEQINGNYKIGDEKYLVFEACEYVESFLHFNPYISIITNVEEDHLDYFSDLNHIISSFEKFARLNSPDGCIIVCSDDKNAINVVQNIDKRVIKYGIIGRNNDFYADNVRIDENGKTVFDVYFNGELFTKIKLNVNGMHNVYNALGALVAAWALGVDEKHIRAGLESFCGTKRRFEILGKVDGFTVVDDYAHHPTEINSTLKTAKEIANGKVWCIFQPHTYTRTKVFLKEFAEALELADKIIITDIYSAREKDDGTVHSRDLVSLSEKFIYIKDFNEIKEYINRNAQKDDMVITMGAGDVFKVGKSLVEKK